MKKKKVMALVLSAAIAAGALSGCGNGGSDGNSAAADKENAASVEVAKTGYPVVEETIKIKAVGFGEAGGGEWEDFPIFKDIEEQTNVEIEWQTLAGDGSDEKLNLLLASKDLPDAVFSGLSSSKINDYASKGILRPIEDLIDNYAPNIKKMLDENPEIRKAITMPDGHIYAVPAINKDPNKVQSTTISLNKDWLEKLNLEVPTTTEEFEAVLEAFKTQDPNGNGEADEVPFTYEPVPPYNIWNGDAGFSGAFGVTQSDSYLMLDENGKMIFTPIQEGYREYIKWTRDLYADGLIDREIFTQDHNQYMAKIDSDRCGGYLTNGPIISANANYVTIEPLEGPNGDRQWASLDFSIDKNRGVITTTNKYPEATMRVIDSFYEPLNTLRLRYGIYLEEVGTDKYKINPTDPAKKAQAPGAYVATCEDPEMFEAYVEKTEEEIKKEQRNELYAPYLAEPIPLVNFTPEESKELSALLTDLQKVVDESKAKWTVGQADIDKEWDSYIESLNNMGLERYLEIYNTALDRFNEN